LEESNTQYAYFFIEGTFDPAEITARAGVEPTRSWRQGDSVPRTSIIRKADRWSLYSRLSHDHELEAHIRDVLDQLEAHRAVLLPLSREMEGCLELVGYFWAGYPGLGFDRDIIEKMAEYSLSVDFDFYGLGLDPGRGEGQ
jgi:hypothetical protein